jgi:hypothetical protein
VLLQRMNGKVALSSAVPPACEQRPPRHDSRANALLQDFHLEEAGAEPLGGSARSVGRQACETQKIFDGFVVHPRKIW